MRLARSWSVALQGMKAELIAGGIPPGVAMTIQTATDGLFMAHLFGMYRPTEADILALRATLLALLEQRP